MKIKRKSQHLELQLLILLVCLEYIIPLSYKLSELASRIRDPTQNKK